MKIISRSAINSFLAIVPMFFILLLSPIGMFNSMQVLAQNSTADVLPNSTADVLPNSTADVNKKINNTETRTVKTGEIVNPFKFRTVQELLQSILSIVVKIGTPIAAFFIILAGFQYVMAAGNETAIAKAHQTFLGALIGTAILLGAQVIATLLANTATQIVG